MRIILAQLRRDRGRETDTKRDRERKREEVRKEERDKILLLFLIIYCL